MVPLSVLMLDARATNCASTVPTHTPFAAQQQSLRYSGSVTRPNRQEETHRQRMWFAGSPGPCTTQNLMLLLPGEQRYSIDEPTWAALRFPSSSLASSDTCNAHFPVEGAGCLDDPHRHLSTSSAALRQPAHTS